MHYTHIVEGLNIVYKTDTHFKQFETSYLASRRVRINIPYMGIQHYYISHKISGNHTDTIKCHLPYPKGSD